MKIKMLAWMIGRLGPRVGATLLAIVCGTANAQETLTYTAAPLAYSASDPLAISPWPGDTPASLSGSVTLSAALGDNLNNVSVTPTAFSFSDRLNNWMLQPWYNSASFVFSTDAAGNITGWNINLDLKDGFGSAGASGEQTASITQGDDVYSTTGRVSNCNPGLTCSYQLNAVAGPGTWTASPVSAPEIDPKSGIAPFLLLAFGLAVIRARER